MKFNLATDSLLIISVILIKFDLITTQYILLPNNHALCIERLKNPVMNRLDLHYKKVKIFTNVSISIKESWKDNYLCSMTLIIPFNKMKAKMIDKGTSVIYWRMMMKISGNVKKCTDYLMVKEVQELNVLRNIYNTNQNDFDYIRVDCTSKLPHIIQGHTDKIALAWMWSTSLLPNITIEVLPYVEMKSTLPSNHKNRSEICRGLGGFWCGYHCINRRMFCDGENDCFIFTKKSTQKKSNDESNCSAIINNNDKNFNGGTNNRSIYENRWIKNLLYFILIGVCIILSGTAAKIIISNCLLSRNLAKQRSFEDKLTGNGDASSSRSKNFRISGIPSLNSSVYSGEVYEELPTPVTEDPVSNNDDVDRSHPASNMISADEETREEILENSSSEFDASMPFEITAWESPPPPPDRPGTSHANSTGIFPPPLVHAPPTNNTTSRNNGSKANLANNESMIVNTDFIDKFIKSTHPEQKSKSNSFKEYSTKQMTSREAQLELHSLSTYLLDRNQNIDYPPQSHDAQSISDAPNATKLSKHKRNPSLPTTDNNNNQRSNLSTQLLKDYQKLLSDFKCPGGSAKNLRKVISGYHYRTNSFDKIIDKSSKNYNGEYDNSNSHIVQGIPNNNDHKGQTRAPRNYYQQKSSKSFTLSRLESVNTEEENKTNNETAESEYTSYVII